MDDSGLRGRSALVLAASGGLGSASALALAAAGVVVVGWGRDRSRLDALVGRAAGLGAADVHAVQADLGNAEAITEAIGLTRGLIGDPDILVNITGGPPASPVSGVARTDWLNNFESMVLSVITVTDHVLPAMRGRGWGRVITCLSSGVVAPIASLGISNTLRSCLVGWSKTLANEVAIDGVTVNTVIPGRISTARTRALDEARARREGTDVDAVAAASAKMIPVGRYGVPDEFGSVVAFLASDRASYITGTSVRVDGGMIATV